MSVIPLETFQALRQQRQAGTLDPVRAAAFDRQLAAGTFDELTAQEQQPQPQQFSSAAPNQASTYPASTPTTGVSPDELATLERRREQHADATGRVAPGPLGLPPNLALAQQEHELLARTLGGPRPPGAAPPAAPPATTAPTAPPTTSTTAPPAPTAAPSPAPQPPQPAYPDTSAAPSPLGGIPASSLVERKKGVGPRAHTALRLKDRPDDPSLLHAERLGLPEAEMPGGPNEFAERLKAAVTGAPRALARNPVGTVARVLGAPGATAGTAAELAARPNMSPGSAQMVGNLAEVGTDLATAWRGTPGLPGGLYTPGRKIAQLGKTIEGEVVPALERAGASVGRHLATPGLKAAPAQIYRQFQQSVAAARAATNPAEISKHLDRAVGLIDRAFPAKKGTLDAVEELRTMASQIGKLTRQIGRRTAVTKPIRKVAKTAAKIGGTLGLAKLLFD
jgi:hypothetical protein